MTRRFLVSASVLTVPIAVGLLATVPIAGQRPSTAAKTNGPAAKAYIPPRTPDGQPELQGFWTNSTYTPLERPKNVTKEFYTQEEAAAAESGRLKANLSWPCQELSPTCTMMKLSSG